MNSKWMAGLVGLLAGGVVGLVQPGCGGGGAKTIPPASGSGAFGVVTVNGKQELFLPIQALTDGGDGQIAVVDVGATGKGVNGVPALVTNIDLGDAGQQATATAGDATVVVAAGTNTYTVWFIDPTSNQITATTALDPSLNGASFSGGGGIVNGIAIDEANHRAILSVWNGLVYVDLGSHLVTGSVLAAGAENFGYDSASEYVLSPFYDCAQTGFITGDGDGGGATPPPCSSYTALGDGGAEMGSGLNLINLKTGKVYTFENPDAGNPLNPVGIDPDAAAVDNGTGVAVVASEGGDFYTFFSLNSAVFTNGTSNTFTAPTTILSPATVSDDGVAIEPTSHLAFFEEEFGSHVSLVDLTKITPGSNSTPPSAFADAYMPLLPDSGGTWSNLGDPHGIAVTTGIQTGDPVGFVVTDQSLAGNGTWVARINLNVMLSLGTKAGTTLDATAFAPAVTYLDATTKE